MIMESVPYETLHSKMNKGMRIMMVLGIGEVMGALLMGQIIDRLGNKVSSLIILSLISL